MLYILKRLSIECHYFINRILLPPAKVMFVIWTISWISSTLGNGIANLSPYIPTILLGYIIYCGIANMIYHCFRSKYNNYKHETTNKYLDELNALPKMQYSKFMQHMLEFFKMDNFEEDNYDEDFIEETEVIITAPIPETVETSPTETTDAETLILENSSHTLVEPQNETISSDEETLSSTETIIETNNTSQIDEIEKVNPIEETEVIITAPIPKTVETSPTETIDAETPILENSSHTLIEPQSETISSDEETLSSTETIIETNNTSQIDEIEKVNPIEEPVQAHEDYLSQRMIITGLHCQFITVARDIVNNNSIDEFRIKFHYKIKSEDYERILQELMDAKIIDTAHNILMSTDTLEHFIDIYESGLFHLQRSHGTFDKDIFICLGELLLQNDIDYAKSCFSSIDELLDYLSIMEKLHLLEFKNGKYRITYSLEEFKTICKGVPEYYNNAKAAVPQSNNISSIDYDSLDGAAFEQYCADILLQNNYQNVTLTKASGDHGIDILAEKDDITYAIQCKCYSSNIGNAAIQQAFTGKKLYRKDIAVVLTNQYFTQQAQEEASSLGVKLWDRDKLNQMIEKTNK